ncbi:MAG: glycoside hydrolase family 16 protein [Verrucomicrobiota bacterium]|nr:glycoside hydrolase family 16 protein [Verrucomicrobiota bacterium]
MFWSKTIFGRGIPVIFFALVFVCGLPAAPPPGYRLVWADEFNGTALDTNRWNDYNPGRRRDAINVPEAVSIRNGCLTIRTFTRHGRQYTGMISTRDKFEPTRGYWEARIRFEDSPGMWSAFWLESSTIGRPIGDPAKAGTEIDICEHRAVGGKGKNLAGRVHQTLHWDGYGKFHKSAGVLTPDLKLGSGFHLYGLEWTDSAYRFYVDGRLTWTATNAISNTHEFVILSSEIQAGGWAGKIPAGGYADWRDSKTKMVVDYVRYYSRE